MKFHSTCNASENRLDFSLQGDLDIISSPELKKSVLEAYQKNPADLYFDLQELDYLDSTGLGVLISLYKLIQEAGHSLHICHAKEHIRKLFAITELDQLFVMGA